MWKDLIHLIPDKPGPEQDLDYLENCLPDGFYHAQRLIQYDYLVEYKRRVQIGYFEQYVNDKGEIQTRPGKIHPTRLNRDKGY